MPLLSAAVVLVGVLCLFDLVLTLGVVRRLRDHTERLSAMLAAPEETALAKPGDDVKPFTTTTVDGEAISDADFTDPTLVAVFSPDCPACETQVAPFVDYARTFPGGAERTVVVIASETAGGRYRREVDGLGRIVTEAELRGPVQKALSTRGYPAFFVVVDGRVAQSSHAVADLPQHQAV